MSVKYIFNGLHNFKMYIYFYITRYKVLHYKKKVDNNCCGLSKLKHFPK